MFAELVVQGQTGLDSEGLRETSYEWPDENPPSDRPTKPLRGNGKYRQIQFGTGVQQFSMAFVPGAAINPGITVVDTKGEQADQKPLA